MTYLACYGNTFFSPQGGAHEGLQHLGPFGNIPNIVAELTGDNVPKDLSDDHGYPDPPNPCPLGKTGTHLASSAHQTSSDVQDHLHYCSDVCSSALVCSGRRLLGKRPGHSRVQQRVPEAPAPVWPRTRLSSPGQVGESHAAVTREEGRPILRTKNCRWLPLSGQSSGCLTKSCFQEKQHGVHIWPQLVQFALNSIMNTCFDVVTRPEIDGKAV